MKTAKSLLIAMAIVLTATVLSASDNDNFETTPLLAKLSYKSNGLVKDGQNQKQVTDICLSVWPDGHYRVRANGEPMGREQLLQGFLPEQQMKQLRALLDAADFRALSGAHGGLVREGAERFIAEVPRGKHVQRIVWMIPDKESAFPKPAADVIDWLQAFQPKGAEKIVESEFPDVCPGMGEQGVQPVIAENSQTNSCDHVKGR
jgi:hypothetical protein